MEELINIAKQILENLIELNYKLSSKNIGNNEVIRTKKHTMKCKKGGNNVQKGSVTKRKDGRWMGRFYSADKKQISIYAKTKKDCQLALKKAIELDEEKRKNKNKPISNMNFCEWFEIYFKKFKVPIVKESTAMQINRYFEVNIKPYFEFSKKQVNEITSFDVENLLNLTTTSDNVKRKVIEVLNGAFSKLYELGEIKKNPMSELVIQKKFEIKEIDISNKNSKVLTNEEEQIILKNAKPTYKNLFIFALNTGMRISEILAITPNDIDFENKIILVNKQLNQMTQKITTTKSANGTRIIPLFDSIKCLLENMDLSKINSNDRLFDTKYSNVSEEIKRIVRITNIKFTAHTFRKTFSSRCQFEYNIPIKIVQGWLGHESEATTDKYYTFANNDLLQSYVSNYNSKI